MRNRTTPADLPFVGKPRKSSKRRSFWDVPKTGNYHGGTHIGSEMGATYLEYLAGAIDQPPILPQIVLDMTAASGLSDALHGQLVGFFSFLEVALRRTQLSALLPTKEDGEI